MAAAFFSEEGSKIRKISTSHGTRERSGEVGLSLSEIEDIDYLMGGPNSTSSLVRLDYLNPPNIVQPRNSAAPLMELSNNTAKTEGSLHKVCLIQ